MANSVSGKMPVVFQQAYDLTVWYANHTVKFPKGFRFTLADRIQETLLNLVEALQDACYARSKGAALQNAQRLVDQMRLWNRLAKDLRCLSVGQYAFAAERIEEIGKQVGGWKKSLRETT